MDRGGGGEKRDPKKIRGGSCVGRGGRGSLR